jgi:hypothetical protein
VSQHGEGSMKFGKEDYPALFCAADRRSAAAQRTYICLTGGILSLLVAGAALAAVSGLLDSCKSAFAITSAVLLAISLALSTYAKATAPERAWYGGRALAESVKSVAWRYMTGARPYPLTGDQSRVDAHFIADLQSILKERSHLAFTLGGEFIDKPQISEAMRALRASGLETRKAAYVCERISDQRRWLRKQCKAQQERKGFVLLCYMAYSAGRLTFGNCSGSSAGLHGETHGALHVPRERAGCVASGQAAPRTGAIVRYCRMGVGLD